MPGFICFIYIPVIRCYDILSSIVKKWLIFTTKKVVFMITVIKIIIIKKEKEGKDKEKKRMSDEPRTWDLHPNVQVLPQGHEVSL